MKNDESAGKMEKSGDGDDRARQGGKNVEDGETEKSGKIAVKMVKIVMENGGKNGRIVECGGVSGGIFEVAY